MARTTARAIGARLMMESSLLSCAMLASIISRRSAGPAHSIAATDSCAR
jgi:hypothetical protein